MVPVAMCPVCVCCMQEFHTAPEWTRNFILNFYTNRRSVHMKKRNQGDLAGGDEGPKHKKAKTDHGNANTFVLRTLPTGGVSVSQPKHITINSVKAPDPAALPTMGMANWTADEE